MAGKRVADEMQAEKPDALNKPSVKSAAVSIEQLCAFDQDPARQCTNVASKHVLRLRIANVTGRLSRAEYLAAREQLQAEDLISARHFKITRYVLLAIVASVALIGVWPLFG
ncbi:hypothetical protein [Phyllobacterium myrsinacearum]|nr:hypothetical protein [Phyllobacterium myrsinacearum]